MRDSEQVSRRSSAPPQITSTRFRIGERLGKGGMGWVFSAFDHATEQNVALKVLRAYDAEGIARFRKEFRALQDVSHPNLVRLGDLVEEGEQHFLTMELVRGVDILTYVRGEHRETPPSIDNSSGSRSRQGSSGDLATAAWPRDALLSPDTNEPSNPYLPVSPKEPRGFDEQRLRAVLPQLVGALRALHDAGKVHRDVKPSNILVEESTGRVVLLDFGVISDEDAPEHEARLVGTVQYMAPEQALARAVGPEADWYALGTLLFVVLSGRYPFLGAPMEVIARKQFESPSPADYVLDLPEDLVVLCNDLMRIEPGARPTGQQLFERLRLGVRATSRRVSFVGREEERAALFGHLDASRSSTVAVFLTGESGIGKSALAREFLRIVTRTHLDAVIAWGRCYQREASSYKGLDDLMAQLAGVLHKRHDLRAHVDDNDLLAMGGMFPAFAGFRVKRFPSRLQPTRDRSRISSCRLLAASAEPLPRRCRWFCFSTTCSGSTTTACSFCKACCAHPKRLRRSSSSRRVRVRLTTASRLFVDSGRSSKCAHFAEWRATISCNWPKSSDSTPTASVCRLRLGQPGAIRSFSRRCSDRMVHSRVWTKLSFIGQRSSRAWLAMRSSCFASSAGRRGRCSSPIRSELVSAMWSMPCVNSRKRIS